MTVYEFSDPVQRATNDDTPLIFSWPRTGVEPTVTVSFDGTTFVAVDGTVEELDIDYQYKINYSSIDRPSIPGLAFYKIEEGGDSAIFILNVTPSVPTVNEGSPTYSAYGPKRVKTKQMEIEQFDPRVLQDAEARANATLPSFCESRICVGVPKDYADRESNRYRY